MKSRITKKFLEFKKTKRKAFVPFITAGDPNLKATEELIHTLEKSGAALIELGMPFTDPMADGPVIQHANERSLAQGTTLASILKLVKNVRRTSEIPILLMGYYNPIFKYGLEKFVDDAVASGVDGLLIVDLPAEESQPLRQALRGNPLDLIFLLTPTSNPERVNLVKKYGSGFVYYVSLTGITGAGTLDTNAVEKQVCTIQSQLKLPICVGFGISQPAQVRSLSKFADGVVVGSSIVKLIEKQGRTKNLQQQIEKYVKSLVNALC